MGSKDYKRVKKRPRQRHREHVGVKVDKRDNGEKVENKPVRTRELLLGPLRSDFEM